MAVDAITGFLEGTLSGFERGTTLRRQRTIDQQNAEQIQRQRIAEQIEAGRQAVLDQQNADRSAREGARFELETGLAPVGPQAQPQVPQDVSQLRGDVGRALDPGSVVRPGEAERFQASQVPAGFERVGPSTGERESERVQALRANVGRFLGASPDERTEMLQDPAVIGALEELGQLGDVFERRTAGQDFGVTAAGISGRAPTPEAAIDLREQFTAGGADVDVPKVASDLRAEFARDPTVKDSAAIAQAFSRMLSVTEQPSSGAGDLAIIFSFMKLLDPGSVVREGEFANAQNSQGVPDRIRSLYNRVIAGERLTDDTRLEFIGTARNIVGGQREALGLVLERFQGLAERGGVAVQDVTFDPFGDIGGEPSAAIDAEEDAFLDDLAAQGLSDEEMAERLRARRQGR